MAETKVIFYRNERAMQSGIKKMQRKGWSVVSTEVVDKGWSCWAVGCFGLLLIFPLLLGKKPRMYKVQYSRN